MADLDEGLSEFQRILMELRILQEENQKIFENGPRRLVRQVCMGEDGFIVIRFYHVCDNTAQRSLDIGETVFRAGICQVPFNLKTWADLPGFIAQVREVSESIDESPANAFRDEIYTFIHDMATKVAQEHQKLHDMLDVNAEPAPTSVERFHSEKVSEALQEAKRAGIHLVLSVGDGEKSAPAHSETQMEEKSCHVCGCLVPCRPGDEPEARAYHPRVPSYSASYYEPDQKRSRTGY